MLKLVESVLADDFIRGCLTDDQVARLKRMRSRIKVIFALVDMLPWDHFFVFVDSNRLVQELIEGIPFDYFLLR
jgi:hypothetical protein